MEKLKVYLDTSVISFYFAHDAKDFMNATIDFFENYLPQYNVYISDIVLFEIDKNTDPELQQKMLKIVNDYGIKKLATADEVNRLAKMYLDNKILPPNKTEDALHIAFCTYYEMDILLSWNFKHLANIHREHKIITENAKIGYTYPLRLLSPLEVLNDQD